MATYDPNKTYTWGPDTKFVISGQDFSLMLHTIRGILSTKEATNTILAYEFNKKIEEMMASGVAEGKVVEAIQAPEEAEEYPVEETPVIPLEKQNKKRNLTKSDA